MLITWCAALSSSVALRFRGCSLDTLKPYSPEHPVLKSSKSVSQLLAGGCSIPTSSARLLHLPPGRYYSQISSLLLPQILLSYQPFSVASVDSFEAGLSHLHCVDFPCIPTSGLSRPFALIIDQNSNKRRGPHVWGLAIIPRNARHII